MTKVILLGDSIRRIGYGTKVPELLGENYTVWQPEENCRFAYYTLRMLFDKQSNQLLLRLHRQREKLTNAAQHQKGQQKSYHNFCDFFHMKSTPSFSA